MVKMGPNGNFFQETLRRCRRSEIIHTPQYRNVLEIESESKLSFRIDNWKIVILFPVNKKELWRLHKYFPDFGINFSHLYFTSINSSKGWEKLIWKSGKYLSSLQSSFLFTGNKIAIFRNFLEKLYFDILTCLKGSRQ